MKALIAISVLALAATGLSAAPEVASQPAQASASAAGASFNPIFSADGRYFVFVGHANNLVTNDNLNPWLDVFARDLVTSNTVLVSVSASGVGGANADAHYPSVSSNGQFIAFASRASNLVPGDTNDSIDVFVRDIVNNTTRLVSVDVNGNAPVDPNLTSIVPLSGHPMISGDGRWVFFESRAPNLTVTSAPAGSVNIYARDTWSNATVLVSADFSDLPVDGRSRLSSISSDGRLAAFVTATPVISGTTNTGESIYLSEVQSGQIVWATTNCSGCHGPVLDSSGTVVAYFRNVGTGTASVFRHNRTSGETLHLGIATNLNHPIHISADGNVILYNQRADNGPIVYIWKPFQGTNGVTPGIAAALSADGRSAVIESTGQLNHVFFTTAPPYFFRPISLTTTGTPSTASHQFSVVTISPDGSKAAFDSIANDLVTQDWNGVSDVFLRDVGAGTTELITMAAPALPAKTSQAYSFLGLNSISADGRFIVSTRYDDASARRDTNGWRDVFVTDLWSNSVVALSVNTNLYVTNGGTGTGGEPGSLIENTNGHESPIISADGSVIYAVRRVNGGSQVFIVGASASNGIFAPEGMSSSVRRPIGSFDRGNSYAPSTSADGAKLVFTTTATDLVEGVPDIFGIPDVVLRQRTLISNGLYAETNFMISVSLSGTAGDGISSNGFLSPDARWVIFESTASNLTTNNVGAAPALYARDLEAGFTHLISKGPNGNSQWGYVPDSAVISGNSRYVAFSSGNIYLTVYDLLTHTSVVADDPIARSPSLSHDGRYAAYVKRGGISNFDQIHVRDLESAQIDLATEGNGHSSTPIIGATGRYVVFQSLASNLVPNDANGVADIFVRDRLLGITMLVSANAQGSSGNGPSTRPVMAADGRTVAFQSFASDLIGGDYNDKRDIFVLKLGSADSDGDGIDDDWEVIYFGDLSRDGTDDFDADGVSDGAEFIAGTDPKNAGSVFRVLTVTAAGGGNRQVIWSGNPQRSYRVEYKDDAASPAWNVLNGSISWNGNTASMIDTSAAGSPNRFYRAVRLP